jgi:hypothetical protein
MLRKKFWEELAKLETRLYYCGRVYRGWPVLRLAFFMPIREHYFVIISPRLMVKSVGC